ncbi:periplasmic protein [Legionella beliardensis]|uniref:Periplasmic protein n=1 Tax=Legionella beliardensis TaxID=91822 RepID=A0A378I5X5_9GAMM|nr:BON domain-containing protein [Legionella beliardensis]STX30135.1 periplasmic protein [Legionella beliardensis]
MDLVGRWKAIVVFLCCTLMQPAIHYSLAQTISNTSPTSPEATNNKAMEYYDQSILTSIRTALGNNAKKITIHVDNGLAYLSGQLNSYAEYEQIVMLVESTLGVVDVNAENLTVVGNQAPLRDTLLRAKIKGILLQSGRLGKEVSTWPVQIEVNDGQVSLIGKVASLQEKQFIIDTVKSFEDVETINDRIEVTNALPVN